MTYRQLHGWMDGQKDNDRQMCRKTDAQTRRYIDREMQREKEGAKADTCKNLEVYRHSNAHQRGEQLHLSIYLLIDRQI